MQINPDNGPRSIADKVENDCYQDGTWRCNWRSQSGRALKVFLNGSGDPSELLKSRPIIDEFMAGADQLIAAATDYAMHSEYRGEIDASLGITFDSVFIDAWITTVVWFTTNKFSGVMIGVRFVAGNPTDVYMDSGR